jgi:hypothetical protein
MEVWGLSWEEIVEFYETTRFEERKKLVTIDFGLSYGVENAR